ncbi:hypothetical protein HK101_009285 [Irineochytrium annulatum]|nr:hypothetical protein HK101_009285 [Irineochytrium annulatum]
MTGPQTKSFRVLKYSRLYPAPEVAARGRKARESSTQAGEQGWAFVEKEGLEVALLDTSSANASGAVRRPELRVYVKNPLKHIILEEILLLTSQASVLRKDDTLGVKYTHSNGDIRRIQLKFELVTDCMECLLLLSQHIPGKTVAGKPQPPGLIGSQWAVAPPPPDQHSGRVSSQRFLSDRHASERLVSETPSLSQQTRPIFQAPASVDAHRASQYPQSQRMDPPASQMDMMAHSLTQSDVISVDAMQMSQPVQSMQMSQPAPVRLSAYREVSVFNNREVSLSSSGNQHAALPPQPPPVPSVDMLSTPTANLTTPSAVVAAVTTVTQLKKPTLAIYFFTLSSGHCLICCVSRDELLDVVHRIMVQPHFPDLIRRVQDLWEVRIPSEMDSAAKD